jgi:hypothetical protein
VNYKKREDMTTDSRIKKKVDSSVPFENISWKNFFSVFFETIKSMNFGSRTTFNKTGKDTKVLLSFLFSVVVNFLVIIAAHIFSSYVYPDVIYYAKEVDNTFGAIAPFFPFFQGKYLFFSLLIIPFNYILFSLFYHIGVLPQKPKGNLKTTFKIFGYSEASKIYIFFFYLYLIIARIPPLEEEAYQALINYLFLIFATFYLVTSIIIIIKGCQKLHKLEEHEASFVAFFPIIVLAIIGAIVIFIF